ncbi:CaiB/BaiF CoA-transferase family protein [Celeribacter sp. PS-C1]|uniref:CaiB/BaiF CoA transferase family protein n=1 Tax=Celeribacter sp. PS-C1 TaxID=2820813 RepID=UPI001C682393|nr:CoA transferase [Celeribacter sp. PS-C1]MBW6419796.1 CoA transferase [Celeribacter sp. PS-C1]
MKAQSAELPLAGIKVVELSHLVAAPHAAMLMADEGAEVIKVEPPQGELSRSREPTRKLGPHRVSGHFGACNRGKRSIALDLKNEAGRQVMRKLLAEANIFITNVRADALRRLGLHPDDLLTDFPHLIVVIISGFGYKNAGEYEGRAGLAMVGEALSGSTGLARDHRGNPVWCGFALGDVTAGMTAHSAALLALRLQEKTGKGRVLDITLAESMLPMVGSPIVRNQLADETVKEAAGPNNYNGVPYGTFKAKDGFVNLGVNNDKLWRQFCVALGRPELGTDPRYALYLDRAARTAEVVQLTEDFTSQYTRQELTEIFDKVDVPIASILSIPETMSNSYYAMRGAFEMADDGLGGELQLPIDPTRLTDPNVRKALPRLDQHREEILAQYGFGSAERARLEQDGAFGSAPAEIN